MNPGDLLCGMIGAVTFCVFGTLLIYISVDHFRTWRTIKNTPTSNTMDVRPGLTEIKGYAKWIPGDEIVSPVSNKPCTMYEVLIQRYKKKKRSGTWKTIDRNISKNSFLVADESGFIKVYPDGAEMELVESYNVESNAFKEFPEESLDYVNSREIQTKGRFNILNRTLRVVERVLPVDHPTYVLGNAVEWKMEDILEKDLFTSPFTIIKGREFVISATGEKGAASNNRNWGIINLVLGSIILFIGLIGMIAVVL